MFYFNLRLNIVYFFYLRSSLAKRAILLITLLDLFTCPQRCILGAVKQ